MPKKQIPKKSKPRGRVAQPSYMSKLEFRRHCKFLGLMTDAKIAGFFRINITTAHHWRHGYLPITAPVAMLLRVMVGNGISTKDAMSYLDD